MTRLAQWKEPPDFDADHLLGFARRWEPYGGPTDEDTFIQFGMSRARFNRELWEFLIRHDIDLDQTAAEALAATYRSPYSHIYTRNRSRAPGT